MPEKYVRIVQDMYEGARIQVKSSVELTDKIPMRIMDVLACGIKDLSPWCMLHADDIALCGTRREEVKKKLEEWLKINRKKTVYLRFNGDGNLDGNSDINLQGRDVGSEESTREEVGCGGNEVVKMDEWSHQAGQN